MTPEVLGVALAGIGGLAAGLAYFAGLWWTVQRMADSASPLRLALFSFALRAALLLAGLALLAGGEPLRLMAALVGLVIARQLLLIRRARPARALAGEGR